MRVGTSVKLAMGGVLCGTLVLFLFCLAVGKEVTSPGAILPDLIRLDISEDETPDKMPAVLFFHDRHTEALSGKGCDTCHPSNEKGGVHFSFKRKERGDYPAQMALFHDNCIGCHVESKAAGAIAAGPTVGQCRSCHVTANEALAAGRDLIQFDRSLHHRHVAGKGILPAEAGEPTNCSACHHNYDTDAKKIFYAKNEESSCRYCHLKERSDTVRDLKAASHDGCVACHLSISDKHQKTGPLTCAGCHDAARFSEIEKVADPPRIDRRQPDAVLLATSFLSADTTEGARAAPVPGVAFNHKIHEENTDNCRSCHHASLASCGSCHTPKGSREGGFIRLEQAMHAPRAKESCIGCHRSAQAAPRCAGCHDQMPEKAFSGESCLACHSVSGPEMEGLSPGDLKQASEAAARWVERRPKASPLPPEEDIPETVTVAVMADQYKGARFPHRKIVQSLAERVKSSPMAAAFHEDSETLCRGCHHNGPVSPKPAACATCHGVADADRSDGRPALMGAYHGQCITCHEKMGIKKPEATNCTACHPQRES